MLTRAKVFSLIIAALLALTLVPDARTTAPSSVDLAHLLFSTADSNAGWEEVGAGSATGGGISDNSRDSRCPLMAIAPDGTAYVAWSDDSDEDGETDEIYVLQWNGSNWEEVGTGSASGGGISNNSGWSRGSSIAIASNSTPYVAWNDWSDGDTEVYVRRWNGYSWVEVGTGSATGGGISDNDDFSFLPSIAIAPNDTPYVAWSDWSDGDAEIYVLRWNGTSWEEVGTGSASGGGISDNSGFSYAPSAAIAPGGTPYVAWHDGSGGDDEIYVRRWNDSSWEEVGTGSASGGGISDNNDSSRYPSVAIAPDGTLYVAWEDWSAGDAEIYVLRWNGSSWEEVGAGSATGGGISDNSNDSERPSVAIAPDGTPYIAWYDYSKAWDNTEIYVRRWDGSNWEEVGAGSAGSGGISDNNDDSAAPSMVTAPDDGMPYIAWHNRSGGNDEIYVRRWMNPPALQVAPTALTFLVEVGGANPTPHSISINSSHSVITWTATVSPSVGWLDVTPLSGTTPAAITATINISGLSVSQYTTQIIVDGGEGVMNSPQTVAVKLIVAEEVYKVYLPLILKHH
jgi:hypothetical protein